MKKIFLILIVCFLICGVFSFIPLLSHKDNDVNNFNDVVYYAFGDSITYGSNFATGYSQMENPYPKLVAQTLGFKSYVNYAISGSTVATNVDGLPSINSQVKNAPTNANIISIMGGVNDYNRNVELGLITDVSTDTFYGSLNNICNVLKGKYENAFIFFMTPFKEEPYHQSSYLDKNNAGYVLEDYVNAIKLVCKKYGFLVLDMFTLGNFELEMSNPNGDGLHPSPEFIKEYTAPQIVDFIKDNYVEWLKNK